MLSRTFLHIYLNSRAAIALLFFFTVTVNVFSQEQILCVEGLNAKAIKLYNQGMDKDKYKKEKRMEFLKSAIELEPNFVEANFLYGIEIIRTAKYHGKPIGVGEKYLKIVLENCPEYHSDVYYYLAIINKNRLDYCEAKQDFYKFMQFTSDDEGKVSRDFGRKFDEAKEDYKIVKFYCEKYEHPVPFQPKIVKGVSTADGEYLPLISPDNKKIYFTRNSIKETGVRDGVVDMSEKEHIERFCYAQNTNGVFNVGEPLPPPFNMENKCNYGGATISLDNRHIYFTICKPRLNGMNCDIYSTDYIFGYNNMTNKEEWYWTEISNMGENVNTPDGWEAQPSLSADGNVLYFASFREDSRGIDIYTTTKGTDGVWGPAVNLGEPINTEFHDKSPFIHSDSHTLYYASEGHIGFGGYDVYYARANNAGKWGTPENIGYPINTSKDEHGFVVSTDGQLVYFGSDILKEVTHNGLDIFSFELYKEARPDRIAFLTGNIKDENNESVLNARLKFKNTSTNEVSEFSVDTNDGSYAAVVRIDEGEDVVMTVEAEDKAFSAKLISSKSQTSEAHAGMEVAQDLSEVVDPLAIINNEVADEIGEEVKILGDNDQNREKEKDDHKDILKDGDHAREQELKEVEKNQTTEEKKIERDKIAKLMANDPMAAFNAKEEQRLKEKLKAISNDAPVSHEHEFKIYQSVSLDVKTLKVGESYKLNDIRYNTNSAEIERKSKVMLVAFSEYLATNELKIAIHGHTDNVGRADENLALSTDRAYSVLAYLTEQGISKSRLTFKGFGATKPIASNSTEAGRAMNRRTEFVITSK